MQINKFGQRVTTVTDDAILGFFGEYAWLSNFEVLKRPAFREVNNIEYLFTSSEAYYMSCKNDDPNYLLLLELCDPKQARRLGTSVILRDNWDRVRYMSMYRAVRAKFFENEYLAEKLVNTGDKYLEETNNWDDKYWGVGYMDRLGENNLGKVLMTVREELQCR
jgi:ribA/ribD-fused uncharacterized protein